MLVGSVLVCFSFGVAFVFYLPLTFFLFLIDSVFPVDDSTTLISKVVSGVRILDGVSRMAKVLVFLVFLFFPLDSWLI